MLDSKNGSHLGSLKSSISRDSGQVSMPSFGNPDSKESLNFDGFLREATYPGKDRINIPESDLYLNEATLSNASWPRGEKSAPSTVALHIRSRNVLNILRQHKSPPAKDASPNGYGAEPILTVRCLIQRNCPNRQSENSIN